MISEGSYDTEDWSNDAEIQIFFLKKIQNKLHFKIYSSIQMLFLIVILYYNIIDFTAVWSNKCSLGEHERLLLKNFWVKQFS